MMRFFAFLAAVLSDPADKQGSTQRVCLFLFLGTVMAWITVCVLHDPGKLPTIPDSILNLVYYVVGVLTGGITVAKGIAAAKTILGGKETANAEAGNAGI